MTGLSSRLELQQNLNEAQFSDMRLSLEKCLSYDKCEEMEQDIENITSTIDLSSHPVHIVNNEGKLNPSALIPFCKMGDEYFGLKIAPFSLPVCSGFEKKIVEGQLCYSLNIGKLKSRGANLPVNSARTNGLKLIIDLNQDRQPFLKIYESDPTQNTPEKIINTAFNV